MNNGETMTKLNIMIVTLATSPFRATLIRLAQMILNGVAN